jgi:hypothetical protein
MYKVPEQYRIITGARATPQNCGNYGNFCFKRNGFQYNIIASDLGWEHVSVHCSVGKRNITPTWEQMCFVKDLFWGKEDCVIQFHPPQSQYVNVHPHVLHLWRPVDTDLPTPPKIMV